jgi:hypothetical protein
MTLATNSFDQKFHNRGPYTFVAAFHVLLFLFLLHAFFAFFLFIFLSDLLQRKLSPQNNELMPSTKV